jgi:hypothetical protein
MKTQTNMASDQRCIKSMNICLIILHHVHNYVAAVQILVIFRKNVEVTSLKAISNNTQIVFSSGSFEYNGLFEYNGKLLF